MSDGEIDSEIQKFQLKRLIKELDTARGSGTSLITLIIRPGEQIAASVKRLRMKGGHPSISNRLLIGIRLLPP